MKQLTKTIQEPVGIKGRVVVTICDGSSLRSRALQAVIAFAARFRATRGYVKRLIDLHHSLHMKGQTVFENIVPTVGRTAIAKALTANLSSLDEIEVNESALGTGSTSPANGDTTLDTEAFRKSIASQSYSSNVAYNTAFYTAGDCNGTYYEHGLFIDGTGAADSGTLLSRVLLNSPTGIAKSSAETLTIEHQHTIS